MKILVFADTHNSSRRMLEVAMRERGADVCIHLGDGMRDAQVLPTLFSPSAIYKVQGNADVDSSEPEERLVIFEKTVFFLTHGHQYGVKYGLDQLLRAARENGADAALFGHTHLPHYELKNGIHLFNPGSLTMPRGGAAATYGTIEVEKGKMPRFDIVRYEFAARR